MYFYELSLRDLVPEEAVARLLGTYFGLAPHQIGTQLEYAERLNTPMPLTIGLDVRSSAEGYRTFASWVHEADYPPASLLTLALEAARAFATEVAIADVIEPSEFAVGKYLIVSPDGRMRRAIEVENGTR